jgi:hypothetical protein
MRYRNNTQIYYMDRMQIFCTLKYVVYIEITGLYRINFINKITQILNKYLLLRLAYLFPFVELKCGRG